MTGTIRQVLYLISANRLIYSRITWIWSDLLKTVKVVKSFEISYSRTVQYPLLHYLSGASVECRFAFLQICLLSWNKQSEAILPGSVCFVCFAFCSFLFFFLANVAIGGTPMSAPRSNVSRSHVPIRLCRWCFHRCSPHSRCHRRRPSGPGCSARWHTGTGCWRRTGRSPFHRCRLRSHHL